MENSCELETKWKYGFFNAPCSDHGYQAVGRTLYKDSYCSRCLCGKAIMKLETRSAVGPYSNNEHVSKLRR